MKSIPGYYGYYIDQTGQVYSRRNTQDGSVKPLTIDKQGRVRLTHDGKQRQVKVSELLIKTWGREQDDKKSD